MHTIMPAGILHLKTSTVEFLIVRAKLVIVFLSSQVYYWQFDPPSSSTYIIGLAVGKPTNT